MIPYISYNPYIPYKKSRFFLTFLTCPYIPYKRSLYQNFDFRRPRRILTFFVRRARARGKCRGFSNTDPVIYFYLLLSSSIYRRSSFASRSLSFSPPEEVRTILMRSAFSVRIMTVAGHLSRRPLSHFRYIENPASTFLLT